MDNCDEARRAAFLSLTSLAVFPRVSLSGTDLSKFKKVSPGRKLPNHKVLDGDGRLVQLPRYEARIHLVNLWATWCGPCVNELPALNRLRQWHSSEFRVTLLAQDKGGPMIASEFLRRLGLSGMSSYSDPSGSFFKDLGCRGLPTTFVITGGDLVRLRVEGELEWDSKDVPDKIRKFLL